MAPLLGSPVTPSPISEKSNPRRILPIVPAVPRSLDRKPKPKAQIPVHSPGQEAGLSSEREKTKKAFTESASGTTAQTQQNGEPADADAKAGTSENQVSPIGNWAEEVEEAEQDEVKEIKTPSTITTQGFKIERHGFKLPPPFYPKRSPPAAISTDLPSTTRRYGTLQEPIQTPPESIGSGTDPKVPRKRCSPLRGSAPIFFAQPTPPSDSVTSPTASSNQDHALAPPISFQPQPTPPTDVTPSPVELPSHNHGNAHNISFYPPPPPSDAASSPARSVYQGYSYGPIINGCPPHVRATPRASISSRSEIEDRASSFQYDYPGLPYYNNYTAFSPLGSQPPLTPSATPFSNMPQQLSYVNGYPPPENTTYNFIPPLQHRGGYVTSGPVDPCNFGSAEVEEAENGLEASQDEAHESKSWRTERLNRVQDIPETESFSNVPLVAYLQQNFNLPEFADCQLIIAHRHERYNKTGWFLSSLLLAQSPKLREVLQASQPGADGRRLITLTLTDRFITPNSVESALRVCYGESPQKFTGTNPQDQYTMSKARLLVPWMTKALSYAATGCLLQLDGVTLRGLEVATKILDWENLEAALSFGLESDFERGRSDSAAVVPAYRSLHDFDGHRTTSFASSAPRFKKSPAPETSDHPTGSTTTSEDYQQPPLQSAFDLLMHCLRFITHNFPGSWQLDVSARPLADVDRLPVTPESRSPLSRSRFSGIQFGDLPSEAAAKSTDRNTLISTILLSLPFIWLDYLLKSVDEPIRQNMTFIVMERERRRQIVLQSESIAWEQREAAKDYEWAEAGYEESVEESKEGELKLSRKYTGIAHHKPEDSTASSKV
ncbi:hypothetical protein N7G274_000751 [Stereocaulon virgatum]|uniref:BTB domain-containing protein n=1 Tax=Stereocaulon virgatum TaxID=373712 RepID=A0ABR4AQB1_9LECA